MVLSSVRSRFLLLFLFCFSSSFAAIPSGYTGKPYGGTPLSIPGKFYADRADSGACNIAYFHPGCPTYPNMLKMTGIDFAFDCVLPGYENDAMINKGDIYWAYIEPGEWMKATINVTTAGMYQINMQATNGDQQDVLMLVTIYNGTDSTESDTLRIPYIGSCGPYDFHSWFVAKGLDTLTLSAGLQVIKVQTISNGPFNIRWTELAQLSTSTKQAAPGRGKSAFRIEGLLMNGANASVRFVTPNAAEARINLFDAQGRLAGSEMLSSVRPGANCVVLKGRYAPGMYLVWITQAGKIIKAKTALSR
jgi:hypothetical protein